MLSNTEYALIFKAMSDETRLKILQMLVKEELCACHILEEFNITQPTLSYHMKILVDCNLVYGEKDGNWIRYRLNQYRIKDITVFINHFLNDKEVTVRENQCV